jgi:aryl-alcohol dehydrogenase-like predicted oxidoreductase
LSPDGGIGKRLILGTAQLGMPYGIANRTGQPSALEARNMVKIAWESGIQTFDTAQGYGDSEATLGKALRDLRLTDDALVVTKIDMPDNLNANNLRGTINSSLDRLGVSQLYGLLWHREQVLDLLNDDLREAMSDISREGMVKHWGISIYKPSRALQAVELGVFDILQMPANILDRRFAEAGVFKQAVKRRIQIHIRSIFLQGLLLMDLESVPVAMNFALPVLTMLQKLSLEMALSRREIALLYVKTRFPDAYVIIGAETTQQVRENVDAWSGSMIGSLMKRLEETFADVEESIVDPTKWSIR